MVKTCWSGDAIVNMTLSHSPNLGNSSAALAVTLSTKSSVLLEMTSRKCWNNLVRSGSPW